MDIETPDLNYPANVWDDLHSLQHIDHSFEKTSNEFVYPTTYDEIFDWYDTNTYQESIQMFIALSCIFGIFLILLVSCSACCCNCFIGKDNVDDDDDNAFDDAEEFGYQPFDDDDKKIKKLTDRLVLCHKLCRWCCSCLIILACLGSIVFLLFLNSTIQDIQDVMDDSYVYWNDTFQVGWHADTHLHKCETEALEIYNEGHFSVKTLAQDVMTGVDQTLSGVHYVLGDVNKIYWYNSGTQFDPYRETIFYISALVPVVTIIFVILSCIAGITVNWCTNIIAALVVANMINLLCIASVQFGLSIELSDACDTMPWVIVDRLNYTTYEDINVIFTPEMTEAVQNYLHCGDPYNENELISRTNQSIYTLQRINTSIQALKTQTANTNLSGIAEQLAINYNISLAGLNKVYERLQCENLNDYYVEFETLTCEDAINEWFTIYSLEYGAVLLLIFKVCCTCRRGVHRKTALCMKGKETDHGVGYGDDGL